MPSDHFKLIAKALGFFVPYFGKVAVQRVASTYHAWTWQAISDAKNVVVVGGSFAGIELVKRLAETLPTGFKVVWIEKNSHLNYSFNFPRFSVMTEHEHEAFIPYDGVARGAPEGIFTRIQDTAVGLTEDHVLLSSGDKVPYAYLAIATGTSQPLPVQVSSTEHDGACYELQSVQETIKASQKIAIVGGGAVGVQLSSDIKDFYPKKDVTLIHSRGELMSNFGKRLREYTLPALRDELKIRVILNERPKMPPGGNMVKSAPLTFSDGRQEEFDLIMGCTGQRPNSSMLDSTFPYAISKETGRILVQPTLQIRSPDGKEDTAIPIFAFGDVAEHGGPRMARAGWMQSRTVLNNILALTRGAIPTDVYKTQPFIEGAIKLTLGKTHYAVYSTESDGTEILVPGRNNQLDLGIRGAWRQFGADFKEAHSPGERSQAVGVAA